MPPGPESAQWRWTLRRRAAWAPLGGAVRAESAGRPVAWGAWGERSTVPTASSVATPCSGCRSRCVYKFFDDQSNYLAAIITYYAFVAIFPLLLLASSILGFVLQGRPGLQQEILNSTLSQFPIIGDQLGRPEGLQGLGRGVVVGGLAALYGVARPRPGRSRTPPTSPGRCRATAGPNPVLLRAQEPAAADDRRALGAGGLGDLGDRQRHHAVRPGTSLRLADQRLGTVWSSARVLTLLLRLAAAASGCSFRKAAPGAFPSRCCGRRCSASARCYVSHVLAETSG